ncbi:MAG: hypothetical protein WD473_11850 [Acidimicrobiia bacterium]
MRQRAGLAVCAFSVTVVSWLMLVTLFALPVLAEDEDEDEGTTSTTTTTLPTTTTTTTLPTTTTTTPTTTTSPPPPTTSTTTAPTTTVVETNTATPATAPPTTTTTLPTATTTTAPADNDATVAAPPPDETGPTNPTSLPPSDGEPSTELTGKVGFVVSFESARNSDAYAVDTGSNGRAHIDPREQLSIAFRAVAETLESQILQAVILGVIVATLTLIGVDRVWDRRLAPSNNPIERPVP